MCWCRSYSTLDQPANMPCQDSPLQLVVRRRVLVSDAGEVTQDLSAVDGEAGQQDEFLPRSTEQACVILDGELAEERQLLNP